MDDIPDSGVLGQPSPALLPPFAGGAAAAGTGMARPTEAAAPAERVRFVAPGTLGDADDPAPVVLVNLSLSGAACLGPAGLAVGSAQVLSFRLDLAAAPQAFACEVVWTRPTADGRAHYGLHFGAMPPAQAAALAEVVAERVAGRAAAWPLPPLPGPELAPVPEGMVPPARQGRPPAWIAASAGLAVGVAVALAGVTLLQRRAGRPPRAPRPAAAASLARVGVPASLADPALNPTTPTTSTLPPPALRPTLPQPNTVGPLPGSRRVAAVRPAPPATGPRRRRKIGLMQVEEAPDQLTVTLLVNGPVRSHEVFWLREPQRLVVDVPGRRSGFRSKLFEIGHPLVNRVRVGHYGNKVRFVVETGRQVSPTVHATRVGHGVRLAVSRAE